NANCRNLIALTVGTERHSEANEKSARSVKARSTTMSEAAVCHRFCRVYMKDIRMNQFCSVLMFFLSSESLAPFLTVRIWDESMKEIKSRMKPERTNCSTNFRSNYVFQCE
ncbi:hypothetical protein DICVIV_08153, partial [Dictyocaulus viviparus]